MSALIKILGCENSNRNGDVIFIHGLDGDAKTTWQADKKSENLWPAWIGEDFPNIGVWSLGYEVAASAWKGTAMPLVDRATNVLALLAVHDIGSRPLLFVTHSLGGLLAKQLIRLAYDSRNAEWMSIAKQVKGIVFLATPHSGSNIANWIDYIGILLRTNVSVDELKAHAPALRDLNSWYRDNSQAYEIKTEVYFETQSTAGILVVDPTSADPGIPSVRPIPIDANHKTICKPESKDALIYLGVKKAVSACLIRQVPARISASRLSSTDAVREIHEKAPPRPASCRIVVVIDTEFHHYDSRIEHLLQHGLSGFLKIPSSDVHIISIQPGSVIATIEIPESSVEKLLSAFESHDPQLTELLSPLALLGVKRDAKIVVQSSSAGRNPKIFISYSHDSREHADRVLALTDRLVRDGVDCVLDQYEESPVEGWTRWMDRQIRGAEFVLMIFTEAYGKRVDGEEESGKGLGVKWEGKLIYQHLYQADANTRFIPIVFAPEQTQFISTPLQDATYYLVSNDEGYEKLYRRLTHQPQTQKPGLGKLRELPARERKQDFFIAPQLFTAKLPTTHSELFGREPELAMLDNAWADPHTHMLTLVAFGGVGKTALVNEWLNRLERDNYRGAERVYGWSFYSQGTKEDKNVSADEFLAHALAWFGYHGEPLKAPWDKGVKLAELIRRQKTLLLLDGMEPMQYPPGAMHGRLKDQGVQALLKELSSFNSGLCVVTTRVQVEDVAHKTKTSVKLVDLEKLSEEAGAQLLKNFGVKGTERELREAAGEFKGHALALNLLGSYLATVHEGEVRKRDLIPQLTEDEKQGGHARRVMESYERWLQNTPELDLLYLMGLFDRPASKGAIDALLAPPAIAGLTSNLQNLPFASLQFALKRLRELRLLAEKDQDRHDALDCHPLVREHFGEKLRSQNQAEWKEAHGRLYEYYKNLPAKELPDTLEEMEPLFAAVAHGCQAGRHQEALDDVYWERIRRKQEAYTVHKLGAFGADLSALSNFFEYGRSQPAFGLTDDAKTVVLNWTGFRLRALGRLAEACQPMQTALELRIKQEAWDAAAKNASSLSELHLTLGEVSQAVASARQSVGFADRSNDWGSKMMVRTTLADALHQSGELTEAQKFFREAEAMQQQRQPAYVYLYSVRGFQFCDLLQSQGQYQEVQKRARQTLEWMRNDPHAPLLTVVLDYLSLGRAFLLQALADTTVRASGSTKTSASSVEPLAASGAPEQYFNQALEYLQQAVSGLREAGTQHHLPRGLFARAACYRSQNEFALAWADLEDAREIAERGQMNLFLADYHLEASRLEIKQQKANGKKQAEEHLNIAAKMIEKMGYGRRKPEVEELRQQLQSI